MKYRQLMEGCILILPLFPPTGASRTPSSSALSAVLRSTPSYPSPTRRTSRSSATPRARITVPTTTRPTTTRTLAPTSAWPPSTCTSLTLRREARPPFPRDRSGWTLPWESLRTPPFQTAQRATWRPNQRSVWITRGRLIAYHGFMGLGTGGTTTVHVTCPLLIYHTVETLACP